MASIVREQGRKAWREEVETRPNCFLNGQSQCCLGKQDKGGRVNAEMEVTSLAPQTQVDSGHPLAIQVVPSYLRSLQVIPALSRSLQINQNF